MAKDRTSGYVTAGCLFCLAALVGCAHTSSGGYSVAVNPQSADTGVAPDRWTIAVTAMLSRTQYVSVEPPADGAVEEYDIVHFEAHVQSPDDNRMKLPRLTLGWAAGLLPSAGWTQHGGVDVAVYVPNYERGEPREACYYDRALARQLHREMEQEISSVPPDQPAPEDPTPRVLAMCEADLQQETSPEARRRLLRMIERLRSEASNPPRTQQEAIMRRYVRNYGPEVLDPEYPAVLHVDLVPWSTSTNEFDCFWSELRLPERFEKQLAAWRKRGPEDAAVRSIMEWYVARYEAAIRESPHLADNAVAASHIQQIRMQLADVAVHDG